MDFILDRSDIDRLAHSDASVQIQALVIAPHSGGSSTYEVHKEYKDTSIVGDLISLGEAFLGSGFIDGFSFTDVAPWQE